MNIYECFHQIECELAKATAKFPDWPTDPLHALAVLGEEFGELSQATLQGVYELHGTNTNHIRKEALQTAAMAIRFLLAADKYEFKQSTQFEQDIALSSSAIESVTDAAQTSARGKGDGS